MAVAQARGCSVRGLTLCPSSNICTRIAQDAEAHRGHDHDSRSTNDKRQDGCWRGGHCERQPTLGVGTGKRDVAETPSLAAVIDP